MGWATDGARKQNEVSDGSVEGSVQLQLRTKLLVTLRRQCGQVGPAVRVSMAAVFVAELWRAAGPWWEVSCRLLASRTLARGSGLPVSLLAAKLLELACGQDDLPGRRVGRGMHTSFAKMLGQGSRQAPFNRAAQGPAPAFCTHGCFPRVLTRPTGWADQQAVVGNTKQTQRELNHLEKKRSAWRPGADTGQAVGEAVQACAPRSAWRPGAQTRRAAPRCPRAPPSPTPVGGVKKKRKASLGEGQA